jgi:hypothetical protein
MKSWPKPDYKSLTDIYGRFALNDQGLPTPGWERSFLCTVDLPYPMRLSWETNTIVRKITCNRAVRASLLTILDRILALYGSIEEVRRQRMDLYGGCYCFRRARGLDIPSVHSWGAAIDLDPGRNEMGKKWEKNKGMMPMEVVELFEAEGWSWGGRWKTRPDAMHFEATNRG